MFGAARINQDLDAAPEDPQSGDRPTSGMRGKAADANRGFCGLTSLAAGWLGHGPRSSSKPRDLQSPKHVRGQKTERANAINVRISELMLCAEIELQALNSADAVGEFELHGGKSLSGHCRG
jgi:hypothetical protein